MTNKGEERNQKGRKSWGSMAVVNKGNEEWQNAGCIEGQQNKPREKAEPFQRRKSERTRCRHSTDAIRFSRKLSFSVGRTRERERERRKKETKKGESYQRFAPSLVLLQRKHRRSKGDWQHHRTRTRFPFLSGEQGKSSSSCSLCSPTAKAILSLGEQKLRRKRKRNEGRARMLR